MQLSGIMQARMEGLLLGGQLCSNFVVMEAEKADHDLYYPVHPANVRYDYRHLNLTVTVMRTPFIIGCIAGALFAQGAKAKAVDLSGYWLFTCCPKGENKHPAYTYHAGPGVNLADPVYTWDMHIIMLNKIRFEGTLAGFIKGNVNGNDVDFYRCEHKDCVGDECQDPGPEAGKGQAPTLYSCTGRV